MPSPAALRDHYTDTIHRQGFVSIPLAMSGSDIDPLFSTFRQVLTDVYEDSSQEMGQHIINAFATEVANRPYDGRGFIKQRRAGTINPYELGRAPGTDNKDVLHFTPQTNAHATEYLRLRGGMPQAVRSLIGQCTELHQAIKGAVSPIMQALGTAEYCLAPKGREMDDVHLVRIIRYLGTSGTNGTFKATDDLAELHFDRSKFTTAVWESAPGLVGAPGNNAYGNPNLTVAELDLLAERALTNPIDHRSGEVKFFAGAGYNHLPREIQKTSGNIPLLLHGVTDEQPGEERDAIVIFINNHAGIRCDVAGASETGFGDIREYTESREKRYGGAVA